MKAHQAEHESDNPAQPPSADNIQRPHGDLLTSWAVPIPGLALSPEQGQVRRRIESADPLGGTELSADIAGRLARRRGQGRPLPPDVARSMGEAMGANLGNVRIHTGPEPAQLARSIDATAFTQGTDIYFGTGSYAPQTTAGQRLLAHELAHTVQPGSAAGSGQVPIIGLASDPAEAAADRVAEGVLRVLRRRAAGDLDPGRSTGDLHRSATRTLSPARLRALAARSRS